MLIFLDTEYTGLSHPAQARKLLSLALVAEDGSAEWYAELDGWELADCDPWVQDHVVPLMTGPRLSRDAARASLQVFRAIKVANTALASMRVSGVAN